MKLANWLLFLVLGVCSVAAAWSHEEIELFELQQQIIDEKKDKSIDFYKYFGLSKGSQSTFDEINQAYKTLSRKSHPDKLKRKKDMSAKKFAKLKSKAEKRFQRISVIGEILRSDRKERYDYFLKNGFPTWKGSGYFYSKYRPSFITTVLVIFVIVSIIHYVSIKLNANQQRKRIETLVESLKRQAWGPSMLPSTDLKDHKVYHPASNKFFLVKLDGSVYLIDKELVEGEDYEIDEEGRMMLYEQRKANRRSRREAGKSKEEPETLLKLDVNDVAQVTFKDSLIIRLPVWLWNTSVGKVASPLHVDLKGSIKEDETSEEQDGQDDGHNDDDETIEKEDKEIISQKSKSASGSKVLTLPNGKKVQGRRKK